MGFLCLATCFCTHCMFLYFCIIVVLLFYFTLAFLFFGNGSHRFMACVSEQRGELGFQFHFRSKTVKQFLINTFKFVVACNQRIG